MILLPKGSNSPEVALPPCEPGEACWAERHSDAADEPCWRAIEAEAGLSGVWQWVGIGRLDSARSIPNGTVYYYGDKIEIQNAIGLWVRHRYTCVWSPDQGRVLSVVVRNAAN